jgi:hypothetical protein
MNPDLPADAELDNSGERLADNIKHSIMTGSKDPIDSKSMSETGEESSSRFSSWMSSISRILNLRPVQIGFGFALGLLLFIAIKQLTTTPPQVHAPIVLRGSEPASLTAMNPEQMPDGSLKFSWSAMAGVEKYELVILDGGRNELIRLDGGSGTSLSVDPASIPGSDRPDAAYLWRIVALQDGDEVARSSLRSLALRSP